MGDDKLPPFGMPRLPRTKPVTLGARAAKGMVKPLVFLGGVVATIAGVGYSAGRIMTSAESKVNVIDEIQLEQKQQRRQIDTLSAQVSAWGQHLQYITDRMVDFAKDRGFAGSRGRPRAIPSPPPPIVLPPDAGVK